MWMGFVRESLVPAAIASFSVLPTDARGMQRLMEAHGPQHGWDIIKPMPAGAHSFALPSHPNTGVPLWQSGNTLLFYLLPQDDQDDQGDDGEDQQGQDDRDDDHLEWQGYNDNRDSSQTPPPLHGLSILGKGGDSSAEGSLHPSPSLL